MAEAFPIPRAATTRRVFLGGLLGCLALPLTGLDDARASTTERIANDPLTGLALWGRDPVSYFVDGRPLAGAMDIDLRYGGVTWIFRNEGNREAFKASPDVYMPRFGGYDPVVLARNGITPGHPDVYVLHQNRIVLFRDEANRSQFLAGQEKVLMLAELNWPQLRQRLTP